MNVKNYGVHITFLTAICVAGNAIITMPFFTSQNPILTVLLCCGITFAVTLIALPIINYAFNTKSLWFYIVAAVIAAVSLYGAASAFSEYIRFLNTVQLKCNRTLYILLLIIVVTAITFCSNSAFLKLGLLFGIMSTVLMVILFVVPSNIYSIQDIRITPIVPEFKDAAKHFLKYFSPMLSAVAFAAIAKKQARFCSISAGVGMGIALVLLCTLQSLFVLGGSAADYKFPYLAAISAFSSGQIYIRLDGFIWFVFFAASTIKTALCTKTVWLIIKRILKPKTVSP